MPYTLLAISNHGGIIGGGEHSLIDLLGQLSGEWRSLAVVPEEGAVADRLRSQSVPVATVALPAIRPWGLAAAGRSLQELRSICRGRGVSLIYANGSRAAFYGGLVGMMTHRPVVWHCRVTGRDRLLDPILERLCTRIVTNSHATLARFKGESQKKITVVHNGIDIDWFQSSPSALPALADGRRKIILMVARRSRWKRHDLALSAFDLVASADPAAHLVCIGNPDSDDKAWDQYLRERVRLSAFHERIKWMDAVEDVRPWYHAAAVSLLTSQNEPFGRVLVEAMACGVPIVSTTGGGVGEIIRNSKDGFLVDSEQPSDIAAAIIRLLNDEGLRHKMGLSARKRSKEFSLSAHIRCMAGLFEDTLKQFSATGEKNATPCYH
jgi:glycosyltransferase involved in cell wall biosynthesis